ncbi:MAG: class I SAM-dependent methyltransferase [Chloroflexia bacterium]
MLTSCDLADLVGCWEMADLVEREAEWPAIRCNAENALWRLSRYRPPPGRLLDLGCGWGYFLAVAREHGWEPYGLEPLAGHALYARAHTGATVITDVLHDDTFPTGFFDVVTAFQVFEHLPDPAGDLARLHNMLKSSGVILVEVPNIATWSVRLLGRHHRHFVPDHLTFFSPRTLAAFLRKMGFEVLEVYRPTRWMTLHHLLVVWGKRLWPGQDLHLLDRLLRRTGLRNVLVPINLGDIVAVIGRKCDPAIRCG